MADVFVSYAREDRARADLVARNLASQGLEVFWDSEIPPGQTWADYVEEKLSKCKVVIVLWSEHSTKSQWVREEARMGRDRGKLIPAMIDSSAAPFGFGEVQAANLATWNGEPDHPEWRRFAAAVQSAVGPIDPNARPTTPTEGQPPMRPGAYPQPQAFVSPPKPPPAAPAANAIPGGGGIKPIWIFGGIGALVVVLLVAIFAHRPTPGPVTPETPTQQQDAQQPADYANQPQPQQPQQANNSPQAIIMAQLQGDQQALSQQGFQMIGQPATGGLGQGQTLNVPVQLVPGVEYRIVGVCDADCRDLDLTLHDNAGNVLAQDTATDDHPVVTARAPQMGNYVIDVSMYNCSVAPCYFAVALYGRQG